MSDHLSLQHELEAAMQLLFLRHPSLCGFVIETRRVDVDGLGLVEHMLCAQEIAVHPEFGADLPALLEGEIAAAISRLLVERPEAFRLLSGRTFARTLH